MKLLILTCLVAVALARPKFPVRPLEFIQNQPDNHEEILKQRNFLGLDQATPVELTQAYFNQLNRQRELLRQKQIEEIQETRNEATEEHIMAETEQRDSITSSSSEEVSPNANTEEQVKRMSKYDQVQQEQVQRMNKYNQVQQEQLRRMNEYNPTQVREPLKAVNQEQVPFYSEPIPQIYPLNTYPYTAWYYPPQYMPNFPFLPSQDLSRPTASENVEKTEVVLQW